MFGLAVLHAQEWAQLAFIYLVWILWVAAEVMEKSVTNAALPREKRGGVTIVPGIIIFPLFFCCLAVLVNLFAAPWGTRIIARIHAVFGAIAVVSIAYNIWRLRRVK